MITIPSLHSFLIAAVVTKYQAVHALVWLNVLADTFFVVFQKKRVRRKKN